MGQYKVAKNYGTFLYFYFQPLEFLKGPVTLGYGLTRSHAEGAKATHRESAAVSVRDRTFPGGHRVTFRGNRVHPSAAANQLLVQKFVAKRGCPREPNHP